MKKSWYLNLVIRMNYMKIVQRVILLRKFYCKIKLVCKLSQHSMESDTFH